MSAGQAELLGAAARRTGRWWPGADGLPAQVIHGDLAPGNVLADPDTGEVTGLLDLELAGAGFRAQDILAALYNSTALRAPDWPARTAAFWRGCASIRRLEPAEVAALPELLIARSLGSVLWRAARREFAGGVQRGPHAEGPRRSRVHGTPAAALAAMSR
jgi:homoserine kinase type II